MAYRLLIFALTFLLTSPGYGQANLNLKFFGLSLHPKGDPNARLMPLNPDGKGYLVFNLGGTLAYEQFIRPEKVSIKGMQAAYSDCAARLGGFTHLGLRWVIFRKGLHSLNGGLGPTLVYRRSWYGLPGYIDSGYFNGGPEAAWQYKFIPYAGEFEYNYTVNQRLAWSATFVPGYPDLLSLSVGFRYWLKEKGKAAPEAPLPPGPTVKF